MRNALEGRPVLYGYGWMSEDVLRHADSTNTKALRMPEECALHLLMLRLLPQEAQRQGAPKIHARPRKLRWHLEA